MAGLTDISDRLTPSVPLELTFGAQQIATGRKITTLFGHRAASGGSGLDYSTYDVINVGDPVAAKSEVDGVAGAGSQLGKMAAAFVSANSVAGRSSFPAFRIVLIPIAQSGFGPADEAISAVGLLRSDMFVSCYPPSNGAAVSKLQALATLVSGPDRDLNGQFGSFVSFADLDPLATQITLAATLNSRQLIVHSFPDSNTADVVTTGDTTSGQPTISNMATTVGIYPGAAITAAGVTGGFVGQVTPESVSIVDANGDPLNATATHAAESVSFQNSVSQPVEIVAAAAAGAMMASAFPYNPLNGVEIGGLIPPQIKADIVQVDPTGESEAALIDGLAPLRILPGNKVGFLRTRTTITLLPDNVTPVTAYFDWQDLVLMNDFREDVYTITQNPPFNNNPGGTKASQRIAAFLKDEIIREALDYEDENALQAVKTLAPQFLVQPSTTSRGRFDFKVPINIIPGLMVIAGNIQAVTTFDFTL